jgi:hypothetical protein
VGVVPREVYVTYDPCQEGASDGLCGGGIFGEVSWGVCGVEADDRGGKDGGDVGVGIWVEGGARGENIKPVMRYEYQPSSSGTRKLSRC